MFDCRFRIQIFLSRLKTDWDTVWHKAALWSRECFNTKIFLIEALINQIISVNWFKWINERKTMNFDISPVLANDSTVFPCCSSHEKSSGLSSGAESWRHFISALGCNLITNYWTGVLYLKKLITFFKSTWSN